jgi:transposase
VVALHAGGVPAVEICDRLNLGRGTVHTWLKAGQFPERAPPARGPRVPARLAPHLDYLLKRWAAGCHDPAVLGAELRDRGFDGATHTVHRLVRRLAANEGQLSPATDAGTDLEARRRGPSPRAVSWLLFAEDAALTAENRAFVAALCARDPALGEARELAHEFRRMLREHDTAAFLPWMAAAHRSELRGFVRGLRYDAEAVYAAIALPWSQGQVEGQVHRLKLVKRAGYGRGGFALIRRRMLGVAA